MSDIYAVVVMGVSGCGKSTICEDLAQALNSKAAEGGKSIKGLYIDGDNYHSESNKQKMASGVPLTDEDRHDWLLTLHDILEKHCAQETVKVSNNNNNSYDNDKSGHTILILACSALKEKYRVTLSQNCNGHLAFAFLDGDFDLFRERLEKRKNHFMTSSLLTSQFATLENPVLDQNNRNRIASNGISNASNASNANSRNSNDLNNNKNNNESYVEENEKLMYSVWRCDASQPINQIVQTIISHILQEYQ